MARQTRLASAVGKRLRALRQQDAGVRTGDPDAVHQMRVASRRLREVLPVLAVVDRAGTEIPDVGRLRRRARRLTRALGQVRELDVAIAHLDEFARRDPSVAIAAHRVVAVLQSMRTAGRAELLACLDAIDVEIVVRRIRTVTAVANAIRDDGPRRSFLARRIATRADELEAAVAAAGTMYVAARVHAVRIAAKKLRYALELAREVARVPTLAMTRRLKEVQDQLGELHDLDVLAGYVRSVAADGPRRSRDARSMSGLTGAIEADIARVHAAYVGRRTVLAGVVTRSRRDVSARLVDSARAMDQPAAGQPLTGAS